MFSGQENGTPTMLSLLINGVMQQTPSGQSPLLSPNITDQNIQTLQQNVQLCAQATGALGKSFAQIFH